MAGLPLVADYLIAERTGSRVEILGTDHGQKLLGRHSNRKEQVDVDASIGELPESLRTGPWHVFHADSEGGPLVVLDLGALKRGPGTPLVVSDERINKVSETYRGLRNTLRYQLSNLYDFDSVHHLVEFADMLKLLR